MDKSIQIETFCRYTQVSRETINSLKKYEDLLINSNKSLNLIGKSTTNDIWIRHFLDSAQVIDFIDKNNKIGLDIGSGAGFPGIVVALIARDRGVPIKMKLYEKSPKKSDFLIKISNLLDLNVEVVTKNIFDEEKFSVNFILARAFKPIEIILDLIHKKVFKWNQTILFMGQNTDVYSPKITKHWKIEHKEVKSITRDGSKILMIRSIKKIS
tara:strand:+ start:361 stop:996 length:636 start_codon:yes stop_codon:yes gene_type:complete